MSVPQPKRRFEDTPSTFPEKKPRLKDIPPQVFEKNILPILSADDLSSLNQTDRHFYHLTAAQAKEQLKKEVKAEFKRVGDIFNHKLKFGSLIKFVIDDETNPRTGQIDFDAALSKNPIIDQFYCRHIVTVFDIKSEERFTFKFYIDAYLKTVNTQPFDEDDVRITIVNDDLIKAQKRYMMLKQKLVGAKIDFFSKKLTPGHALKLF